MHAAYDSMHIMKPMTVIYAVTQRQTGLFFASRSKVTIT